MFDLDDEYHRNIINRNKLQGTPLYLPWMQGITLFTWLHFWNAFYNEIHYFCK